MKEKDKRDILTNENIVKDYEEIFKRRIKSDFIKLGIFLVYYVFLLWIISLVPYILLIGVLTWIVLGVTGCYILGYYIKNIIILFKNRSMLKNNTFDIRIEKVVNNFKIERDRKFLFLGLMLNPVIVFFIVEPKPYRIVFSAYGEYKVFSSKYYVSSKTYEMTESGVFNRAANGDEHYLVMCGKNIALAYNCKMFNYKKIEKNA